MTKINEKVGLTIRTLRKKKDWSQERLAHETDLHRAYIGQVERGGKNIGLKNLETIAKALRVKITELFG